jgi:SAM-dependent methyltransferase
MTTVRLCTTPNQHARPAALDLTPSSATFCGYQDFVLTPHAVQVSPVDQSLQRKYELLRRVLAPSLVSGRTVLDLGANSAFFSFLALQNGATGATAVDIDPIYPANVNRAAAALGFDQMVAHQGNVADWRQPADIVVALALVHWLHNCTATFGTLGAVIDHLAALTGYALIVEWIDSDDPMIAFFDHLGWNPAGQPGPYEREIFERELAARFARIVPLGEVSPTRRLFLAFKRRHEIDLTCPLPLLHPASTVISCSRLTTHDDVEYWSRVYALGGSFQKQTTGSLAVREAALLAGLSGAAVPRVVSASDMIESSTVTLERIDGQGFVEATPAIVATEDAFRTFLIGALDLLAALADARVTHRDIHADNVLVRDGRPVLIDFGWAVSPEHPIFVPEGFAPRLNSSDAHAVGQMLLAICPPEWPVRQIVAVMAHDDPAARIEDPRQLRALVDALEAGAPDASGTPREPNVTLPAAAYRALLAQIDHRDRQVSALRQQRVAEANGSPLRAVLADAEIRLAHLERLLANRAAPEEVAGFHAQLADLEGVDAQRHDFDIAPSLRPYALAFAAALRRRGQAEAGLAIARQMLRTLSEAGDLHDWLAATYLHASLCRELGHDGDALRGFDRILGCDAEVVPARFRGGALYHSALVLVARGAIDEARDRLERCVELLGDHAAARAELERLRVMATSA